ncbi:hypothetical protein [Acinetobacter sp. TUM15064]|uniref:hypothetical protein n=1 Tax=Acinetobacter sp. TUM15064 TaxID=2609134 RepID=UPI00124EF413|nr:hypothetical protein [Acinetobacter sp. TUM15064]
MNTDIKSLLIRVCGTISYLIVIFFFVTFILFLHNDIKDALKEAWSVSASFLSFLATMGAAIIAANLFNDWREQKKYELEKEYIEKFSASVFDIYQSIFSQSSQILNIYEEYNKNENYTILRLDKVDFLKISENDKSAHYLSSFISLLIPTSKFKCIYEDFQESLALLSWTNEQVYNIYILKILKHHEGSPYIALYLNDEKMDQIQLANFMKIIRIIDNKITITINKQTKQVSYSELLREFERSFNSLNSEMIKYINP